MLEVKCKRQHNIACTIKINAAPALTDTETVCSVPKSHRAIDHFSSVCPLTIPMNNTSAGSLRPALTCWVMFSDLVRWWDRGTLFAGSPWACRGKGDAEWGRYMTVHVSSLGGYMRFNEVKLCEKVLICRKNTEKSIGNAINYFPRSLLCLQWSGSGSLLASDDPGESG